MLARAVPVGLGSGAGELSPPVPPECNLQMNNNTRTTTINKFLTHTEHLNQVEHSTHYVDGEETDKVGNAKFFFGATSWPTSPRL